VRSGTPVRLGSVKDGDLATPMELNAYMSELGVVMQLPRKKTTAAMPAVPEPVPVASTSRRGVLLTVMAVMLAIVALLSRLDTATVSREIPLDLRGEWITDHPDYRERRLSFTDRSVGIALHGGQSPRLHPVLRVSTEQRADTLLVTMRYDDDGTPQDFRVVMLSGATRQVELSNPTGVVWVPSREVASPASPAK
jgi:hypothetical protein